MAIVVEPEPRPASCNFGVQWDVGRCDQRRKYGCRFRKSGFRFHFVLYRHLLAKYFTGELMVIFRSVGKTRHSRRSIDQSWEPRPSECSFECVWRKNFAPDQIPVVSD